MYAKAINDKTNIQYEQMVLGGLIHHGKAGDETVAKTLNLLTVEHFSEPSHRAIFEIIQNNSIRGKPFDICVFQSLLGKSSFLTEREKDYLVAILTGYIGTLYYTYVEQVHGLYMTRKLMFAMDNALRRLSSNTNDEDILEEVSKTVTEITSISAQQNVRVCSMEQAVDEYLQSITNEEQLIKTNISYLDHKLQGGLMPKSMITICGNSGIGKTQLTIYFLYQLLKSMPEKRFLYYSMEMSPSKLIERMLSVASQTRKLTEDKKLTLQAELKLSEMLSMRTSSFIEGTKVTMPLIINTAMAEATKGELGVIVVDHVSLLKQTTRNRKFEEMESWAVDLDALGRELGCLVIVLQQANREPEKRRPGDKCPRPSDAAQGSAFEWQSSYWIGIHREKDHKNIKMRDIFEMRFRKNRDHGEFDIALPFNNGLFGRDAIDLDKAIARAEGENSLPIDPYAYVGKY